MRNVPYRNLARVTGAVVLVLAGASVALGGALHFSPTTGSSANAYVTFGAPASLGLPQFTLETWFRRDGGDIETSTGTGGIARFVPLLAKGVANADGTSADANYFLGIDAAQNVVAA